MQIRAATAADYPDIVNLIGSEKELFLVYPAGKYPFTLPQLGGLAASRTDFTVVVDGGRTVGFANLYAHKPPDHVFIGNVIIDEASRGKGFGRALVSYMTDLAFDTYAVARVRISVFSDNIPAVRLYSRCGFTPYALEERKDPAGEPVILLHLQKSRETARQSGS